MISSFIDNISSESLGGSAVNILIPFYNVDDLNFYYHLVGSLLSFRPDVNVHIVYVGGKEEDTWKQYFSFHKLEFTSIWRSKTFPP